MRVTGIQADVAWEDAAANVARFAPRIAEAAAAGARLVVLPEMFSTGFTMNAELAEGPGGIAERFLVDAAQRHGIHLFGSVAARRGGGRPHNLGILAAPVGPVRTYAKIHPFTFAGESEVYDAGTQALTAPIDGVRTTFLICYDLRFPELFAALWERTDLFVVVASWPVARREHWRTLLRARAIEGEAYVLGVNRVGEGGGLAYAGDSVLVGPDGAVLDEAQPGCEAMVGGDVDAARVAETRERLPFLKDRRPDVYRKV